MPFPRSSKEWKAYHARVRVLEEQGLTTSDAQAVIDAEILHADRLQAAAQDMFDALKAYDVANKDGGISMADLRNIAHNKLEAAYAKACGRTTENT